MDREVVEQKLESLRRRLKRIEEKCPDDWQIVHAIASKHLEDFTEFARKIKSST